MPMGGLLLGVGGLLAVGRRRTLAAGGRGRGCRGGRRRRRGGAGGGCRGGGRCRGGRRRTWRGRGALVLHELDNPVDDQRDQDQNTDAPRDEHHRPAVPLDRLGLLVERIERSEGRRLITRGGQRARRRRGWLLSTDIDVPGRLIVEVVGRASGCHGTDGTDTARLERVDLLHADEHAVVGVVVGEPGAGFGGADRPALRAVGLVVDGHRRDGTQVAQHPLHRSA